MGWYGKNDDDNYTPPLKPKEDEKSRTQRYLNKDAEEEKIEGNDDVRLKPDFDK